MPENLTYRLFQPDDLPGILRLWEEESGWGGISAKQFDDWYINTPYGECLIVVAVDEENTIVGQKVFTPSRVCVAGAEKKALRLSAPILKKKFRARISNTAHPIVGMFKSGVEAAAEQGFSLIYSFPLTAWLPVVKSIFPQVGIDMKNVAAGRIECFALSLNLFSREKSAYETSVINFFSDEYDALWQSAVKNFPLNIAIVRKSDWLNYKFGGHLILEVRTQKKLVGYAAIKKETGLIEDALAATPGDLQIVVKEVVKTLSADGDTLPNGEIKLKHSSATASIIENLAFQKIDFKFGFWCFSPDGSIPADDLQLSRWFMMPGD